MPYLPHNRITVGGYLGSATLRPEIWSCTMNFGALDGSFRFNTQADADALATAWATFHSSPDSKIGSTAHFTTLKLSATDATNKVLGIVYTSEQATPVPGGTGMASGTPFQLSYAVSMRSGLRGPANRGRIYLPQPQFNVGVTTGTIADDTAIVACLTAFKTMVASIRLRLTEPLIIASRRGGNVQVQSLYGGRIVDTIRSRRNALSEDYQHVLL